MLNGIKKYQGKGHAGGIGWEQIAKEMPRLRSAIQCSTRWNSVLRGRLKGARAGRWTVSEVRSEYTYVMMSIIIVGCVAAPGYGTIQQRGKKWRCVVEACG